MKLSPRPVFNLTCYNFTPSLGRSARPVASSSNAFPHRKRSLVTHSRSTHLSSNIASNTSMPQGLDYQKPPSIFAPKPNPLGCFELTNLSSSSPKVFEPFLSYLKFKIAASSSSSSSPTSLANGVLIARHARLEPEKSSSQSKANRHPSPLLHRPSERRILGPTAFMRKATGEQEIKEGEWRQVRIPKGGFPKKPNDDKGNRRSFLKFLDSKLGKLLPDNFIIYTLLGLNAAVFLGWLYASSVLEKYSDPRSSLFMAKNFLCGIPNLREGRWWTLLTSCVSHQEPAHFLLNMVSLAFMAPPVIALTGPATFLALYFGAGITSSIVSTLGKAYLNNSQNRHNFSHGASGSVYAIMSVFACVHPKATFLVFFVIPAPAWAVVSGIFAWDLWNTSRNPDSRVDSAGHLGGILTGLLFWRFGLKGVRIAGG